MLKMRGADAQFRRMLSDGMILCQRILHLQAEYAEFLCVGIRYLNLFPGMERRGEVVKQDCKEGVDIFCGVELRRICVFPEKLPDENGAGLKVIQ